MDERQARAYNMSREIVNMGNELEENQSTLVAQSLSMAVAMLVVANLRIFSEKKKQP